MTPVIPASSRAFYVVRMTARDEIQRLAAVLRRPSATHIARLLDAQRAMAGGAVETSRQLGMFVDRVADLSLDELRELHDETFKADALAAVPRVADRLARGPADASAARTSLNTLAPALERLEANRNPFAYVVRALCCALLTRAGHSRNEAVPPT